LVILTAVSFVIFIKLKAKAISINTYLQIRADNFAYQHILEGNKEAVSSLLEMLRYYGIAHFEGQRLLLFESIFDRRTIVRVRKP
jgi:hypothetical protein